MKQEITTRTLAIGAAMLLVTGLSAAGGQEHKTEDSSFLVDVLMSDGMTREQMVGLYEDLAGDEFEPPDCVEGEEMFDDVPASHPFCSWIEELARRGITGGCNANDYCPGDPVSRAQMAVFVVRAMATDVVVRSGEPFTVEPGDQGSGGAACQPGERATGGGVFRPLNKCCTLGARVVESHPTTTPDSDDQPIEGAAPTGWWVHFAVSEDGDTDHVVTPYVVCARP